MTATGWATDRMSCRRSLAQLTDVGGMLVVVTVAVVVAGFEEEGGFVVVAVVLLIVVAVVLVVMSRQCEGLPKQGVTTTLRLAASRHGRIEESRGASTTCRQLAVCAGCDEGMGGESGWRTACAVRYRTVRGFLRWRARENQS